MKEVKKLYIHIILVVAIVIVSIFIWPNNKEVNIIESNQGIVISFEGFKSISVLSNDDYELAVPSNIYLKNISNSAKDNALYFKYSKVSTLEINSINISLDDRIYNLNDLDSYQDNEHYYFKVGDVHLESYSTELITTRMWTDKTEGSVTSTFVVM